MNDIVNDDWTADECGVLAGIVFSELDDTDYSEYLLDGSPK